MFLRGKYGVMMIPVRIFTLPSRSHSRKYFASDLSSLMSMSLFLKSSSLSHSGSSADFLCFIICLNSESLGISGYTLARESRNASALAFLSSVFMAAFAFISESVRMARLADVFRVILLFLLENVSIGSVGCPRFGIIWKRLTVSSRSTFDPSESVNVRMSALIVPPR